MLHAHDFLDQQVIENGGFIPLYTQDSVSDAIIEMIQIIQLTLNQRKLEIVYDERQLKRLPILNFDKRRLQQVLLNLLSNAVKFMSYGFVTVKANLIERSINNIFIEVSVEDKGVGISDKAIQNIFKPFNVQHGGRRQIIGNGVGLSICKQICQQFDGDITVSSVPQMGSTFTFTMKVFLATNLKKKGQKTIIIGN